ncbi:zinc finger protein 184-like [Malaya genurostris]|uniref:zinc finger protein 184-like n=1 Tax=Malaya genurostris TaxID=325434 RepID=UPI0026F38409|nr:zinc finger protein 184-like [Malaya genurostris]
MLRICRTCGQSLLDHDNYESLEKFVDMYYNLTTIQLREREDLNSLKVCTQCATKLQEFDCFRKVCLEIYWRFHDVKCEPPDNENAFEELEFEAEDLDNTDKVEGIFEEDGDNDDEDDKPLVMLRRVVIAESLSIPPNKSMKFEEAESISLKSKRKRAKLHSLKNIIEPREPTQIYRCDRCPRKFRVLLRLNAHKRTHDGLKPFECKLCGKDFAKWNNLKSHHIQKHTDNKIAIPCEHQGCGQTFATRQGLKRHRLRAHDPNYVMPDPKQFVCDSCGKTFSTNGALKKHQYVHTPNEMPFVCGLCGKKFPTSHKLKEHTMRHEGIKNHTCPFCGLRKTTMHELRSHIGNVHSRARSYPCDICSSVFTNIGNLNRHVKIVHLGLKPYSCSICNRSFGKSDHLRRHMKSHKYSSAGSCTVQSDAVEVLVELEPTAGEIN